ncbi:MAG: hypothetical protein LBD23_18695 [Oscillospiraceae bacterium]|nr:hypothetical protein [Oscillospiraceae bacterium]
MYGFTSFAIDYNINDIEGIFLKIFQFINKLLKTFILPVASINVIIGVTGRSLNAFHILAVSMSAGILVGILLMRITLLEKEINKIKSMIINNYNSEKASAD